MNKQQLLINGGVFVVGAGLGFGAGYLIYKKKFEAIAREDIESVREAYSKNAKPKPNLADLTQTIKSPDLATKTEVLTPAEDIIYASGYASLDDTTDADLFRETHGRLPTTYELIQMGNGTPVEDAVRHTFDHDDANVQEVNLHTDNLFENPPEQDPEDIGDGTDELPPRSPNAPYVIEVSEWFLNETGYDQVTLTFWADDDVLADITNHVIVDIQGYVGSTNMHRFGFKSNDPEIVYVRNEKLKTDFEITKDERNFSEVIHNVNLDDNNNGAPRRMRSNDE